MPLQAPETEDGAATAARRQLYDEDPAASRVAPWVADASGHEEGLHSDGAFTATPQQTFPARPNQTASRPLRRPPCMLIAATQCPSCWQSTACERHVSPIACARRAPALQRSPPCEHHALGTRGARA